MAEKLQIQGHMKKALAQVDNMLRVVDGVLEVADARAPLLTRFPYLIPRLSPKHRHILVLTHADTADGPLAKTLAKQLKTPPRPENVVLWKPGQNPRALLKTMTGQGNRVQRWVVVGLPNVGKSHLINRLTGRNLPRGNRPGITRALTWTRPADTPGLEILDTPGLLPPKVKTKWQRSALRVLRVIDEKVREEDMVHFLHLLWPRYGGALMGFLGAGAESPEAFMAQVQRRFSLREDNDGLARTTQFLFKALDQGKILFTLTEEDEAAMPDEQPDNPVISHTGVDPWAG